VGQTGAGKSSLAVALWRLRELESGSITIDSIDLSTVALEHLRTRLSIIPQDPLLFRGTIRHNLDPFEEWDDSNIWDALRRCRMESFVRSKASTLSHEVTEGGTNLSVGQRQLLCMARAILKGSKIVIMDEATASVDLETERLIQDAIVEEFKECTVLTIAHRLSTVLSCDQILVMSKGRAQEIGPPSSLVSDQESAFYQMMKTLDSHHTN